MTSATTEPVSPRTQLLAASSAAARIAVLRTIKNATIGHQDEKLATVQDTELVTCILELLEKGSHEEQLQAAYIVGSLAHGTHHTVTLLTSYPVIPLILKVQSISNSPDVRTAGIRALVALLTARPNPALVAQYPDLVQILMEVISSPETPLSLLDQASRLVACLCPSSSQLFFSSMDPTTVAWSHKLSVLTAPLAARIATLYEQTIHQTQGIRITCLDSCLYAFSQALSVEYAELLLTDKELFEIFHPPLRGGDFLKMIVTLTRSHKPELRLTAVSLLAKLRGYTKSPLQQEELTKIIIPVLIPILDQLPNDSKAIMTLASVCVADEKSAATAVEVGVVKNIVNQLKKESVKNTPESNQLTQSYLLALAGIGLHRDEFRMEIVENGALNIVLRILSANSQHDDDIKVTDSRKVKVAACHVLRALSRSVKLLRTSLGSMDVTDGFKVLLSNGGEVETLPESKTAQNSDGVTEDVNMTDTSSSEQSPATLKKQRNNISLETLDRWEVQTAVMAAVCNLILEFSPLHKAIMEKGFLDIIVDCAHSPYDPLRLNSIWALKNVVYEALRPAKQMVLEKVTWPYLLELCDDPEYEIEEQALDFLRNIVCRNVTAIDNLFVEYGPDALFDMIANKLATISEEYPRVLVAALYVLVHIAAGSETHRDLLVTQDSLLQQVVPLVTSSNADIRTACVWLVINLTHVGDHGNFPLNEACRVRAQKLIELGFKEKLSERSMDATLDIRERVRTALFQLEGYNGPGPSV